MPKLVILGSASAIPSAEHENTHLAFVGKHATILIDTGNNPIVRLEQAGIDFNDLSDVILTHYHPDHVSGFASLLMSMWLLGRQQPLRVHGLDYTIDRIEALMEAFEWQTWPKFFPTAFQRIPAEEMALVLQNEDCQIVASPVQHIIPTIGLRISLRDRNLSIAYSCDTEPCPAVVRLAEGASALIHEASGAEWGHSAAAQAGEIARQAGATSLYLIHYPARGADPKTLVADAQATFGKPVILAQDFMALEF